MTSELAAARTKAASSSPAPRLYAYMFAEGPPLWFRALSWSLAPLGWVYGGVGWLRDASYRLGWRRAEQIQGVTVVSIGNMTAGGSGKTPTIAALLQELTPSVRVGVVTRGYGGSYRGDEPLLVHRESGATVQSSVCGDEPWMLSWRFPDVPIAVTSKRAAGVRALHEHFATELVLLDDGFHHQRLARDLDVVLLSGERPLGNGRCLPAGPLREFPRALNRADALVLMQADTQAPSEVLTKDIARFRVTRREQSLYRVSADGLEPVEEAAIPPTLLAFAGIGQPEMFFDDVRRRGWTLAGAIALADHEPYPESLIAELARDATGADGAITTLKDAIKLINRWPVQGPLFAADVTPTIEAEGPVPGTSLAAYVLELHRKKQTKDS